MGLGEKAAFKLNLGLERADSSVQRASTGIKILVTKKAPNLKPAVTF
jgi:hypothetical protein